MIGQRCGFTDTIQIGNLGVGPVTINIEDYLNNDLSNPDQGLCEVSLYFQHSYVYDFNATITSPAGQRVTLVGPINGQTRPPTTLARWFIDFVRCDSLAAPDGQAQPTWDNDDFWNWPAFGVFQGDYFPNNGCLEDFNTGPVNGDWTFSFSTARSGEQGMMTYLLLTFCDDRNAEGPCCFADAGSLRTDPEIVTCEQADDLPFDYPPRYQRPRPDSNLYGYTYVIARNDSILLTQDDANLANLPAGDYEICGLSYRTGELGFLNLDGSLSSDDLRADFASVNPTFCGDLTPVCQQVRLTPIPDTTFVERIVCIGGSVDIGNETYNTTDRHITILPGFAGCDSIVVLDLDVVDVLRATEDTTICAEAVYVQGSNIYDLPGTYIDTLTSVLGCDSIVTLNLSFDAPITKDTVSAICGGDTLWIAGEPFFETTVTSRVFTAANGCDSTVNIDLLVLDPVIRFGPYHQRLTCDLPNTFLNASGSDLAFTQDVRWLDTLGNTIRPDFGVTANTGGVYIFQLTVGTRGVTCVKRDTIILPDIRFDVNLDLALTQVQCTGDVAQCAVINCRNPEIGIRVLAGPPGPAYDYTWTVPPGGNIVGLPNGPEIFVDAPGTYSVIVEDPVTGCRRDTFITVLLDTLRPQTMVSGNELLTCANPEITLLADTFQMRVDELEFVWTGGCLPGPVTGPSLPLDCPGSVTLTVTNLTNFCVRDTTITVLQDIDPVDLTLAPAAAPLNCYAPTQTLTPITTSVPADAAFAWTRAGSPDTIGDQFTLDIFAPGTYQVIGIDSISRCADTAMVVIAGDTTKPVAISGPEVLSLNCYQPTNVLGDPATSIGFEFDYAWIRLADQQDTIGTAFDLPINTGGTYQLAVFNRGNGCRTLDSSVVLVALDTPFIRLDLPLDFDCFIDSVVVDASMTGLNFPSDQSWTGPCLPDQVDTNRLAAYCPGTYFYTVLNTDNGCSAQDSVEVLLADNSVVAVMPDTAFLDCDTGQTRLDRRLGTDAPVVRWFRDGIETPLTGMQPFVTIPGEYTLVLGNFNESCLDTARTTVVANCPVFPIIVPPDSLTCINTFVVLDARPSVPAIGGGEITEWITPVGSVAIPGPADRQLTVFTPGEYGFAIENTISGDRDTFFVEVIENTIIPLAEAGLRDTITCYEPLAFLDASASSQGPFFDYLWRTTSGDSLGNTQQLEIGTAGSYLFSVTHRVTGCQDIDNVFVLRDTDTPDLAFSSGNIPCDTVDFPLAVIPDLAGNYTYLWDGPAVLAQGDRDTVRIAGLGDYTVTVTDVGNGCSVFESVTANQLPCPPFPALRDSTLTCGLDTIIIAPAFRDPCIDCSFRWERNGNLIPGQTDSTLAVYRTGTYHLIAINTFGLQGDATMVVTDDRIVPEDNAGEDHILTCTVNSVTLGNTEPEPPYPFVYQWLDDTGAPIPGATDDLLPVSVGGMYQLRSTNTFSQCAVLDTVVVTYDTIVPNAVAGPGRLLDCNNKRRTLDGINSSLGDRYRYLWTSEFNELCLEGATTLNPIVRCGGDYTLLVRDIVNGCTNTSTLFVDVDDELPNVIPLPDTTLNCAAEEILLVGREITGPNKAYVWEEVLPGGNMEVAEDAPGVIRVSTAGTFQFIVRDTLSGCTNDFTMEVFADLDRPTAEAGLTDTFFCALDSLILTGAGATVRGITPEFSWTSTTGFQIDGPATAQPTVFQPDLYRLVVTDPVNFCTAQDSVAIFRDVQAPIAFAGRDTTLTCALRRVRLDGSGQTLSGQAGCFWTTPDGNIIGGSQTLTPLVSQAGLYQLNIIDPVNDCTGADIVRIAEDTVRPQAVIAIPQGDLLNCYQPELLLTGENSTLSGSAGSYFWTGPESGLTDSIGQFIETSGDYNLFVTNLRNECRDTAFVTIREDFTAPVNPVEPALPITCARDSALLRPTIIPGGGIYDFRWLGSGGGELSDGAEQVVFNTGNYLLETFDVRNGCADTSSVTVFADRTPPSVNLVTPDVLNCEVTFSAIDGTSSSNGPGFLPEWESPGNSAESQEDPFIVVGSIPGFHYLTVTNTANGCVTRDSIELLQSAVAVDDFEIDVTQPACLRDQTGEVSVVGVTGGAGPFRYRLDQGLLTDRTDYDGLPVGTYEIQVVGVDGCSDAQLFTIEPGPEEFVDLREDTIIRLGDSVLLDFTTDLINWDTLIWTSGGPLPDYVSDGPIWVRPLVSQNYRLQVRAGDGCFATDAVVIQVDETVNTFIPNVFSPNGDMTNDIIRPFVGPQVEEIMIFKVYTRWGTLVYDMAADPGRGTENFGWDGNLNGRPMNSQVFVWEMEMRLVDGTTMRETGDFVLMR